MMAHGKTESRLTCAGQAAHLGADYSSEEGAQEYLTIMSYIGTAHKHGINAFTAIKEALNGNANIIFA